MTADIGPLIALHQVHAAAAAHAHVLASWSQEQPPGHNALPALSLHNLHQRYIIKTRRKAFSKASRHVLHNDHARHRRRQHLHNTPDGFRTACRSADGDDLVCRVSQRPLFLSGNRPLRRKLFFLLRQPFPGVQIGRRRHFYLGAQLLHHGPQTSGDIGFRLIHEINRPRLQGLHGNLPAPFRQGADHDHRQRILRHKTPQKNHAVHTGHGKPV